MFKFLTHGIHQRASGIRGIGFDIQGDIEEGGREFLKVLLGFMEKEEVEVEMLKDGISTIK